MNAAAESATRRGVLLVGATSPLGIAIARRLHADGDRVFGVALDRSTDPAFVESVAADCSHPELAEHVVAKAVERLGRLDVVVVAAAVMPIESAERTTDAQWRIAMAATVDSSFFTIRAALPHLNAGAAVVAVSSVNAVLGSPWVTAYAAAKGAVDAMVRQLAVELGPRGIRVNAVAPGMIGGSDLKQAEAGYPLGRTGTPNEIAACVRFLAGQDASFVTGVILPADGGLSIASPAAFLRPDLRERFL